jgi:hypothetical protein
MHISTTATSDKNADKSVTSVYSYFVAYTAAIGGLLFGYEIGIVEYTCSINIRAVLRMDDFGLKFGIFTHYNGSIVESQLAPHVRGNVTFSFLFGCIFGALLVSWMAVLL